MASSKSDEVIKLSAYDLVSSDNKKTTRNITAHEIMQGDQPVGQFPDGLIFYDDFPVCRGNIDYDSINNAWICTFTDNKTDKKTSIWYPIDKTRRDYSHEMMFTGKRPTITYIGFTAMIPSGVLFVNDNMNDIKVFTANRLLNDYGNITKIKSRKFKKPVFIMRAEVKLLDDTNNRWNEGLKNWTRMNDPNIRRPLNRDITLEDIEHDKFLKYKCYALSDIALDASLDMLKHILTQQKFQEVLRSQDEWMRNGRLIDANQYTQVYTPEECLASSNSKRAVTLRNEYGEYQKLDDFEDGDYVYIGEKGTILIRKMMDQNTGLDEYVIAGETNASQGPVCKFMGYFPFTNREKFFGEDAYRYIGGMTIVDRTDLPEEKGSYLPEFFLIPTKTGIELTYLGSGTEQGCAPGVEFKGFYKLEPAKMEQLQPAAPDEHDVTASPQPVSRLDSTVQRQTDVLLKLTDGIHKKFLTDDNDYALADAMLNATWKMVKKNLDKSAFASVQKEQREWASSKRDERAASYAASMPPSQAYTKVMQERIAELSTLVAREPRLGDYEGEWQMFNIYKDKGEYQIDGSADNAAGNTCMFEGKLTKDGGWYKVHEDGLPPYFVLFTDKGAFIQYIGSGTEHGCGYDVDFKGEYKLIK